MKLNNLTPAAGSKGREKRIGRGEGSGHGGTSTRGHKGAQARSGYSRKLGFEGGQMPIQRRLPKFGFTNPTRVDYKAINVATLQALAESHNLSVITVDTLVLNSCWIGETELRKSSLDRHLTTLETELARVT